MSDFVSLSDTKQVVNYTILFVGGLSEQVETCNEFSSREMRRTRFEMLFKDYEVG